MDVTLQAGQVVAYQSTSVSLQSIPGDQQRLRQLVFERLEEIDDLLFFDASFVQPKQAVRAGQSGNNRDMCSVEVELDDGSLSFGRPGTYKRGALAHARLAHEYDQSAFSLGFF